MNTRTHRAFALIAAGTLATGTLLALGTHTAAQVEAQASQTQAEWVETHRVAPSEDDPTWNCFTDGNGSCGNTPIITLSDGTRLAVLDEANDGHVYGSLSTGGVVPMDDQDAIFAEWLTCIETVEPSDGELAKCDEAFWSAGGIGTPAWDGVTL